MRGAEKIWETLRPLPEDVLANCRANIATCLINLGQFEQASSTLDLAEETAGTSLRPVLANLRQQLEESQKTIAPTSIGAGAEESTEPNFDLDFGLGIAPAPALTSRTEDRAPESSQPDSHFDRNFDLEYELGKARSRDQEKRASQETEQTTSDNEAETVRIQNPFAQPSPPVSDPEAPSDSLPENAEPLPVERVAEEITERVLAPTTSDVEEETDGVQAEPPPAESAAADEFLDSSDQESSGQTESTPQQIEASTEDPSEKTESREPKPLFENPPVEERTRTETGELVERRSTPRAPIALNRFFELTVSPGLNSDNQTVKSFLVDIGPGGLRINSEIAFKATQDIELTLPVEMLGKETKLKARVVWQKALYGETYLQGLRFCDLTQEQAALIRKKLESGEGLARNSRQHFRLYRPFPIKLQTVGAEDWTASYASDLSVDGIGTRLRSSLPSEEPIRVRLELEFELPTVEIEARVAWSKPSENGFSHGLQFTTVGPVEARTIKRYIDRCLEFSPD
jgi:c-di-GMP-binding flagellar brake protein YcgR